MADTSPPTVWRTKLRSSLERVDHTAQVDHCINKGIIGIGWHVPDLPSGAKVEDVTTFIETCGWDNWTKTGADTVRRFANEAQIGDFVWTRHTDGKYWLAKITGNYRYDGSRAAEKVDVHQVRKVEWVGGMNDLDVPGGVVRSFIGIGQSFSRIHDPATKELTPYLWKKERGEPLGDLNFTPLDILTMVLDPYDVEDLIYMWLQVKRQYIALPRTQQKSTPAYEWTMVHRKTGEKGIVQVKTGGDRVDLAALRRARADDSTATFAFATTGLAPDDDPNLVTEVIQPTELLKFVKQHKHLLPDRLKTWFELAS